MTRIAIRLGALLAAVLVCMGTLAVVPGMGTTHFPPWQENPPACVDCHGGDFGGRILIDDLVVGRIVAPNLTRGRGGAAAAYSDADWIKAIREGVARDGRRLILMPTEEFGHYGNGDIVMMTTRLTTLRPVDREMPDRRLGPIGRALLAASPRGLLADVIEDRLRRGTPAPKPGDEEYGPYLAAVGCAPCHGEALRGATTADTLKAPDLGPDGPMKGWT
ncbi:MAG TPA: hypothetical protein VLA43_07870, partial [Longimicrobiales bacterium]|nr:hypothetical protein [Longimicrobiales bacterium]